MPECMAQDGQAAVFVGTFLQNGQSVAVCDEHLVYFCADTLATMTGLDPTPFIAAISDEPGEEVGMGGDLQFPADDMTSDWTTAPADVIAGGPGDGSAYEDTEPVVVPTPPTPPSGRMRAVSSIRPTVDASEQDATTAEAKKTSTAT